MKAVIAFYTPATGYNKIVDPDIVQEFKDIRKAKRYCRLFLKKCEATPSSDGWKEEREGISHRLQFQIKEMEGSIIIHIVR